MLKSLIIVAFRQRHQETCYAIIFLGSRLAQLYTNTYTYVCMCICVHVYAYIIYLEILRIYLKKNIRQVSKENMYSDVYC